MPETETVEIALSWLGVLPALLAVYENSDSVESRKEAEFSLKQMAGQADAYKAHIEAAVPLANTIKHVQRKLDGSLTRAQRLVLEDELMLLAGRLAELFATL